jgi:hypothetical protein
MKMIPKDQALNEFELIWRFSDAQKYTQLSPDEFNRFRPISANESLTLWEKYVYPSSKEHERHLTELYVRKCIKWPDWPTFRSSTENEEKQVVPILRQEIPATESSELLFFWHAEVCVATDWSLFLDHWDDFCYPSDDSNVIVLPEIEKAIIYIEERWHILPRKRGKTIFG